MPTSARSHTPTQPLWLRPCACALPQDDAERCRRHSAACSKASEAAAERAWPKDQVCRVASAHRRALWQPRRAPTGFTRLIIRPRRVFGLDPLCRYRTELQPAGAWRRGRPSTGQRLGIRLPCVTAARRTRRGRGGGGRRKTASQLLPALLPPPAAYSGHIHSARQRRESCSLVIGEYLSCPCRWPSGGAVEACREVDCPRDQLSELVPPDLENGQCMVSILYYIQTKQENEVSSHAFIELHSMTCKSV